MQKGSSMKKPNIMTVLVFLTGLLCIVSLFFFSWSTYRQIISTEKDVDAVSEQITAKQSGQYASYSIGHGHGEHVHQRKHEGAACGEILALPGDDAGKNGDHREDAGGQGKPQSGQEKQTYG